MAENIPKEVADDEILHRGIEIKHLRWDMEQEKVIVLEGAFRRRPPTEQNPDRDRSGLSVDRAAHMTVAESIGDGKWHPILRALPTAAVRALELDIIAKEPQRQSANITGLPWARAEDPPEDEDRAVALAECLLNISTPVNDPPDEVVVKLKRRALKELGQ